MKIRSGCISCGRTTLHEVKPEKDSDPKDQRFEWHCLRCLKIHGWKPYMGFSTHGFIPSPDEVYM